MRVVKLLLVLGLSLYLLPSFSATNSAKVKIDSIESRDSGYHSIFVVGSLPADQGCILSDRAVVIETDNSSKTMLSVALTALTSGKDVVIQVSGCTPINTGYTNTAPKVTKVQIYN